MATSHLISFSVLLLGVQAVCSCSSPTSDAGTATGTGGVSSGGTAGQSASSGGAVAGTTGGATAGAAASGTGGSLATGGSANTSGGSAGATTTAGGSGATAGTAASGGTTVAGTGGVAATGGGGSPPGSGGSAVVTGGNGGTASGGSSGGGAKAGGATGSGGGKGGGAGGSGADPRAAAQVLDGFGLLKPCFSMPGTCAGCTCDENSSSLLNSGMAPENQHITKQFGGDAGVTYNVKLRVVGVAERYWYSGGTLDPTSKVFYTGGLPTIHSTQAANQNLRPGQGACKIHPPDTDKDFPIPFTVPPGVAPADNCYNGFNIFGMTVSSPKQSYFFNYTTDFDGADRQPHAVYKTDYTVTIPIAGQSTLDFYIIDGDHHQVANTTMTVPNLKNTEIKQPYIGNFLELQVVDVSLSN